MSEPPGSESRGRELLARACACRVRDADPGIAADLPVDPLVRRHLLARLRRIERQIRELQTMVMDDDYCGNIMNQIDSAHGALRGAGREIIRNHLRYCLGVATLLGPEHASELMDEVIAMVHRLGR
jgi:CsoR family transcriptional regulator, copper-sensing transcriptional repressor